MIHLNRIKYTVLDTSKPMEYCIQGNWINHGWRPVDQNALLVSPEAIVLYWNIDCSNLVEGVRYRGLAYSHYWSFTREGKLRKFQSEHKGAIRNICL